MKTTTQKILNVLGCEEFTLSLSFVSNEEIAALNQKYRQRSGPTDVLSFPQLNKSEQGEIATFVKERSKLEAPFLGDVVIATDIANRQAADHRRSFESEVIFLIVHSILHLLGYDHHSPHDAKRMRQKEYEVLQAIEDDGKC